MRWSKVLSWVVLVASAAVVVVLLVIILLRLQAGAVERAEQHAEIVALQAGMEEANARLEQLGQAPVPVPEATSDTAVVPIGPTPEQILSAFDIWCDRVSCHGRDGRDGENAPALTQEQMFSGFAAWCAESELCQGEKGDKGEKGDTGDTGATGRGPTTEEILAVVEVVCTTTDACRGPKGDPGADSTVPGPPGPACAEGYAVTGEIEVLARAGDDMPEWTPAAICVPITEGG